MKSPTLPEAVWHIRKLIQQRDFGVVYQPIVELETQSIFAYEVLVRSKMQYFQDPPSMFSAAVAGGMCGELGRIIREVALASCSAWPLFLNIHPQELGEGWLVRPDDPIYSHPRQIYIEITESAPLTHFELCQSVLREMRGKSIMLAVDDLGAGYSNLKYIADLNPEFVKFDRKLIVNLVADTRQHRLVTALVRLCDDMGAKVIAEGIETADELRAVRDTGVQFVQGFLLARPSHPIPAIDWDKLAPA